MGKLSGWFTSLIMLGASSVARKVSFMLPFQRMGKMTVLGCPDTFRGVIVDEEHVERVGPPPSRSAM